ncbi:GTPase [Aureococcus anophagefferens]|nr:GTPase [Aureococcus anophagefferens]
MIAQLSWACPENQKIKLLMIGDSAVGKTSLLLRYANDTFSSTFITTIGIDFKIKTVDLDGKRVNRILVANKCDYESARQVSADEGRRLAGEYNVRFLETSAKNDVNVAETFTTIAREVTARIPTEGGKQAGGQKLKSGGSGGKGGCCK